ncbi:acyl-CoA thioesterase [Melioribacteraceae bacterium 4301-Me]|uniref:acyl-CoA thioesterase n=1 Tax=Pyranulibacter aquaticus TaxID=3163344 RepID=UPI00359959F0
MSELYSKFETEIIVRPDDIDMNKHVHYSKYLDYLLTARYDQMRKDYKMPMEEFVKRGFSWVGSVVHIEYKRGIVLGDTVIVRTQIDSVSGAQVKVNFWMIRKETQKLAAEGWVIYTMISAETGKAVRIPQDIIDKYSI